MPTLIKNVGILDTRNATPEQIRAIGKLENVGCLVVNAANKVEFLKISQLNVGKIVELDDDYKLHTGPIEITPQMLEDALQGVKLCVVGPLTVDLEVSVELLQKKLIGLLLVGPAAVPQHLHGAFMSAAREIIGPVAAISSTGKRAKGQVTISDDYLNSLEDGTDLNVQGSVTFDDQVDMELFRRKITSLRIQGTVKCLPDQEPMMRKVLQDPGKTRIRIIRLDYHYVPGGTLLDTFTMMTVNKQTVSCYGLLILDSDLTEELIRQKDIHFEAGTLYFPKTVMQEMATRLAPGTRGIPYEPGKMEYVGCEQILTKARLDAIADRITLVVTGELEICDDVPLELLSAKVGVLDNYGEILATRDAASILQGKLRQNDGVIRIKGEDEEEEDLSSFDNVIENAATYTL